MYKFIYGTERILARHATCRTCLAVHPCSSVPFPNVGFYVFYLFPRKANMTSPASTSILSWPATPGAETNRATGASSGENSVNDFTPKTPIILAKPTSNSASPDSSLPQQTVYSWPHCLASSSAEDAGAASSAAAAAPSVADVGDSAASDVIMTLLLTSTHVNAAAYDMDLGVLHGIPDQGRQALTSIAGRSNG